MSSGELSHEGARAAIDRHFLGAGRADEESAMRAHVAGCAGCRAHYERRLALSRLDPRALPAQERLGRTLGLRPAPVRGRWLALGALAAAGAAVMLLAPRVARDPEGLAARGAGKPTELFIYSVAKDGPRLVAREISRDAELAFAYANGEGKQRLAVFAVDERRHVFWFHPRWDQPADNPSAEPIDRRPGVHELPSATRHGIGPGRLWIYGLFTDDPLTVRAIEALVAAAPAPGQALPAARVSQVVRALQVTP